MIVTCLDHVMNQWSKWEDAETSVSGAWCRGCGSLGVQVLPGAFRETPGPAAGLGGAGRLDLKG